MAHRLSAKRIVSLDVGLRAQDERLRGIDGGHALWLTVEQSVQDVENVDLSGDTAIERQFARAEHSLLVVLQDERQNFYHLPIAARML